MEIVAQTFEHGGLAGSYFASENDEPFAALNSIDQVGDRFLVLFASIKEGRIGTQAKRVCFEAEEGFVDTSNFFHLCDFSMGY